MLLYKRFFVLLLSILLIFTFIGCSDDNSSAIIYYGVGEPPKNIDPQCANTITELIIVRNLFEGLMRSDENGNIVNGVAESYTKDNNTYTFFLREDAVWSDGTPITADDFVFGFKRALSPETNSPNAECLFSIKNAEEINKGNLSAHKLGVSTIDKRTLKIELTYDDSDFLYMLTTSAAMPCNEDFFNKSIGKYGMSLETVLSNGSYRLRKWSTEDFAMRIVKNTSYSGTFTPKNSAVYFSKSKDETNLERLKKNYVDIAEISTEDCSKAELSGLNLNTVDNKVLILDISRRFTKNMRDALVYSAISETDFANSPITFKYPHTLFPTFFGYDTNIKYNVYNPQLAKSIFNSEIKLFENSDFPCETVYYYGDTNIENLAKTVASNWQRNLGAYVNIAPASNDNDVKYFSYKEYGIGIYTVQINEKNKNEYLKNFEFEISETTDDLQSYIFKNSYTVPICFYGSCFADTSELQGLKIDSFGGNIDFSHVTKKK